MLGVSMATRGPEASASSRVMRRDLGRHRAGRPCPPGQGPRLRSAAAADLAVAAPAFASFALPSAGRAEAAAASARRSTARRTARRWTKRWRVIKLRLFSSMSLSLLAAGWRGQVAEPSRILSEGFQRCLGPRRLVDLGQRPLKVLGNLGEAPLYRACPSDQDIIVARDRVLRGRRSSPPPSAAAAPGCACTAPPSALLAVKPKRAMSGEAAFVSPRARAWSTSEGAAKRDPSLTCRNSARVLRRPIAVTLEAGSRARGRLSRQTLASLGPAPCQHLASARRRHALAEAVAPLADEPRWLIGALHAKSPMNTGFGGL